MSKTSEPPLSEIVIAKSLVWSTIGKREAQNLLLILNARHVVNQKKVEEYLHEKIRLASKEQAERLSNQKIGSILPFLPESMEVVKGFRVLIDKSLVKDSPFVRFIRTSGVKESKGKFDGRSVIFPGRGSGGNGSELILDVSSDELVKLTGGEIMDFSSQSIPTASVETAVVLDYDNDEETATNPNPSSHTKGKNDDMTILQFSPSLLRKIAMTNDYSKMVQVLNSLHCNCFHPAYAFPPHFTVKDHINVASRNGGKTALQLACWKGSLAIVKLLLEFGGNLNQYSTNENNYGKTAIFYAITQCRDDIVKYLLSEHSPNLLIVNNKGQTPLSLAITHLQEDTIALLERREKEQLRSKEFAWMNFYDSEFRGKGVFGDLDPRFITKEQYQTIFDGINLAKAEESIVSSEEKAKENEMQLSSKAISRVLLSTEDDTRSIAVGEYNFEQQAAWGLQSNSRFVPIFPTTLETRRSIRSIYMTEELQTERREAGGPPRPPPFGGAAPLICQHWLQKNLQTNDRTDPHSTLSTLKRGIRYKDQRLFRQRAIEEESLILQQFSKTKHEWSESWKHAIDVYHKDGPIILQGVVTAKRQLSNKLVFLNIAPNDQSLIQSANGLTAFQLRYSWKAVASEESDNSNYAVQLILGKTFRARLENEKLDTDNPSMSGIAIADKICKILKVGHVIEIEGEIKVVQERDAPDLLIINDLMKKGRYFEVEVIVSQLRFLGAEVVVTTAAVTSVHPNASHMSSSSEGTISKSLVGSSVVMPSVATTTEIRSKNAQNFATSKESPPPSDEDYITMSDFLYISPLNSISLPHSPCTKDSFIYLVDPLHPENIEYFVVVLRTIIADIEGLLSSQNVVNQCSMGLELFQLIGMDCEWKPEHYEFLIKRKENEQSNSYKSDHIDISQRRKEGEEDEGDEAPAQPQNRESSRVEVLQLSTVYGVFVLDMNQLFHQNFNQQDRNSPSAVTCSSLQWDLAEILIQLFQHPQLYKIGFELQNDIERLLLSYSSIFFNLRPSSSAVAPSVYQKFTVHSVIDLHAISTTFISSLRNHNLDHLWQNLSKHQYRSLSKLCKLLLKKSLNKEQQCSAWHLRPFTRTQIEYAAIDAAVLIELFQQLMKEITLIHPHNTGTGFLKKHRLITNLKYQLFNDATALQSYHDYYEYIPNNNRFARVRPRNHRVAYQQILIFEKWSKAEEEPAFSVPAWYTSDRKHRRSVSPSLRSADRKSEEHSLDIQVAEEDMIPDEEKGNEFRQAFIGRVVGKSKDYCIKLFQQWYYSQSFIPTDGGPRLLILKQNGFFVINQRHILIFINLLSENMKSPSSFHYDNKFFNQRRYFNFYILEKQYKEFFHAEGPSTSGRNLPSNSSQLNTHLYLRQEGQRAFYYMGQCTLADAKELMIEPSEAELKAKDLSEPTKRITHQKPLFKELFFRLDDYDEYLKNNEDYQAMIDQHQSRRI